MFFAYKNGVQIATKTFLSIGGGEVRAKGEVSTIEPDVYVEKHFTEIAELCKSRNIRLSDYVFEHEGEGFKDFLMLVWQTMCNAISQGLTTISNCLTISNSY